MSRPAPFFIGWQATVVPGLRRVLGGVAAMLLGGALALALALGIAADDPAGPGFALAPGAASPPLAEGEARLEGVLRRAPYPVLHLPDGQAVLLAEDGKRGAAIDPGLEGRSVAARGFVLRRGTIAMLVLAGPPAPLKAALPLPEMERLGRWRITGEICDGKCAAGGMRPGTGLAHRACATLCLDGALPPVFVATAPVAGHAYLLLGAAGGGPLPPELRDRIGLRVTLDGAVERRGDLLVFLAEAPR